jgi:hypothetical protein
LHKSSAQAKNIELHLDIADSTPLEMTTDATRLRQILNNLLSNAVKFTNAGEVALAVSGADNRVVFSVRDTGPGIPPESQGMVFEKFKQLEDCLTKSHGGTGLGLALVKQLAEHLGGEVSLSSEVGTGSVFTVTLPQERANV